MTFKKLKEYVDKGCKEMRDSADPKCSTRHYSILCADCRLKLALEYFKKEGGKSGR
jgi:hypothetical protein